MKYTTLAMDYDGTIAHDGQVDDSTLSALRRARASGVRLLMVTGRELADLFNTFAHSDLFALIVAENGAVLYEPASQTITSLAPPPPPALLEILTAQSVPVSVGHSIVATVEPHEHQILSAIRALGLEWHVIFNKGSVMALPSEVTKATGLKAALASVHERAENTIGVGDAENDHAFLRMCGLSVAVANALPGVKATADLVTAGARGAGVTELIERLLADDLDHVPQNPARQPLPVS